MSSSSSSSYFLSFSKQSKYFISFPLSLSLSLSLSVFIFIIFWLFTTISNFLLRKSVRVREREWGIASPMLPEERRRLAAELLTVTTTNTTPTVRMMPSTSSSSLAVTMASSLRSRSLSLSPPPSFTRFSGVLLRICNCDLYEYLSLSASSLRDRDVLSKSDPMSVIYLKGRDGKLEEIGRTEVVLNSLNPTWIKKVNVTYHFEVVQTLVFHVYDVDTQFHNVDVKMLKLDDQQFLGEASCTLSEVVTKPNRLLTVDLVAHEGITKATHPSSCGKLMIHAEESLNSRTATEITFRCSELENKDLFSKSDPFLVISKTAESGVSIPVCKTEVIKDDLNPTWKPVFLSMQQVGSKDNPLTIECFNFNSNGRHDLIGKIEKSLVDLEKMRFNAKGENLYLPTATGHDYHKVLKSKLFVQEIKESIQYTFLDYLAGGCELNFMVAIDFTASNGNPRLPDSLHYSDPSGRPNAYQKAIMEVGGVLQFYDSDKRFPAWGFGARPIDGPVSHCFNLNGSSSYCEVEGIQGIMTAYMSALFNVSLAGPTLFGRVISTAASIAGQSLAEGQQKYHVLLIITDGVITDLEETKEAIVKASDLPLSILIVGVGGADFKEMEFLDADRGETRGPKRACCNP